MRLAYDNNVIFYSQILNCNILVFDIFYLFVALMSNKKFSFLTYQLLSIASTELSLLLIVVNAVDFVIHFLDRRYEYK